MRRIANIQLKNRASHEVGGVCGMFRLYIQGNFFSYFKKHFKIIM